MLMIPNGVCTDFENLMMEFNYVNLQLRLFSDFCDENNVRCDDKLHTELIPCFFDELQQKYSSLALGLGEVFKGIKSDKVSNASGE